MSILSERLILLRENAGMTQSEVASILQIGRSTYSNYENDYREPSIEMIEHIAKLFNVPIGYLLGDIDVLSDIPPYMTKEDINLLRDIKQLSFKHKYELHKWLQKNKRDK